MQACRVTITTQVDGAESTVTRDGECRIGAERAELRYAETEGRVRIVFCDGAAEIVRSGDYGYRLPLRCGEETVGRLGLGEACGEIGVFAREVAYSVRDGALLASLRYDLRISGETQSMRLRLLAREKR